MSDVMPTDDVDAAGSFPGWRVVGASFVCLATTAGLGFYGLAVYLTVLSREQGWSVGSISAACPCRRRCRSRKAGRCWPWGC